MYEINKKLALDIDYYQLPAYARTVAVLDWAKAKMNGGASSSDGALKLETVISYIVAEHNFGLVPDQLENIVGLVTSRYQWFERTASGDHKKKSVADHYKIVPNLVSLWLKEGFSPPDYPFFIPELLGEKAAEFNPDWSPAEYDARLSSETVCSLQAVTYSWCTKKYGTYGCKKLANYIFRLLPDSEVDQEATFRRIRAVAKIRSKRWTWFDAIADRLLRTEANPRLEFLVVLKADSEKEWVSVADRMSLERILG